MAKNSRKMAWLLAAYSVFCGGFGEETPRNQPINLPTKGVKGMTNQELKTNFKSKNKQKKRRKRLKK